jgi:phenylacetate-CoA ligase
VVAVKKYVRPRKLNTAFLFQEKRTQLLEEVMENYMLIDKKDRELVENKNGRRKFFIGLTSGMACKKEKMARYALKHTKFYKRLYNGSVPGKTLKFEDLPLVHKYEINKASPFDLLSDKLEKEVFKYGETTGSTGSPTPSFFTRKEFAGSVQLSKLTPYHALINKVREKNRRAVCGLACGFTIAGPSFQQILDHYGFLTVNVDARTTIAPPERVARLLVRFRPAIIAAAETDFLSWMKIVEEKYPEHYQDVLDNLQVLLSTAELCSESRSLQIAKHFNILHIDNYACVEGYFSVPCICGEKHILPVYHTEVLSEDLKSTGEYGSGRFAFTNLLRKSTPFVRYLLADFVKIYRSSCPFGFTKSIQPHGRYELTVVINEQRYGIRHFENILFKNHLFGEYRIRLLENKIIISAEDYLVKSEIDKESIKADFRKEFGLPVELEILSYGELRDFYQIRKSKPLLRLVDERVCSMQKVPEYI